MPEDPNAPWESIQRILIWTVGPTQGKPLPTSANQDDVHSITNDNLLHPVPQPIFLPIATDTLPPTDYGLWQAFHPTLQGAPGSPRTCCTVNYFLPPLFSGGAAVSFPFAHFASTGHFLEYRRKSGFVSVVGPRNIYSAFVENQNFTNQSFDVADENGELKIPVNNFFQLPPQATYTVKGFATTPNMTLYNDVEVGNPATFASYTTKKYDKKIEWTINNQIGINLVHDTGFENADEMVSINIIQGGVPATYAISR